MLNLLPPSVGHFKRKTSLYFIYKRTSVLPHSHINISMYFHGWWDLPAQVSLLNQDFKKKHSH